MRKGIVAALFALVLAGLAPAATQAEGLVAAYGFVEGSGTTTADASGTGNSGIISGATWSTLGKNGNALSFDGAGDRVTVADSASLDLTGGTTISAWIFPTALSGYRDVVVKGTNPTNYYLETLNNEVVFGFYQAGWHEHVTVGAALALNTWNHIAAVFDNTAGAVRIYVNGVQKLSEAETGAMLANTTAVTIGFGFSTEDFAGRIDDVRIYNRPLLATEIQTDMNTPVGGAAGGDTTAPTVSLSAPAGGTTVSGTVSVTATASDNVGVAGVQFLLDGANLGAEDTTSPYSFSWDTTTATNGSHVLSARARDAAGNTTTATNVTVTVSNSAPGDTTAPTVSLSAPAAGATVSGTVAVTATASDNVGVAGVQFLLDGANLGAEDTTSPYSVSWNTTTATNGSHVLTARARDAAGNTTTAANVTVTVSNTPVASGLAAGYAFDEASGTTTADASGNGNTGTITGAVRTATGKNGGALSFDGAGDFVTVPDSASLDLTGDMTISAWVNPTSLSGFRDIVVKGTNASNYYLETLGTEVVFGFFAGGNWRDHTTTGAGLALNTWQHLAAVFDNQNNNIKIYVNGVQRANVSETLSPAGNTSALTIGGGFSGEDFAGRIDDVRIYGRALTLAEVQADMNSGVGPGDQTPPTVSISAPAGGSTASGTVTVSATATDNVGVAGVQFLLDGANLGAEDTTSPYSVSWNTTQVTNGSHTLSARARDAAGNTATAASVTVTVSNAGDTTAPTVSVSAPTGGTTVSGTVTVSATASDNVGVAGVQFLLDGASLGTEDTTSPYSISWNTTTATNGSHVLSARARDAAGNTTTATNVTVTVANGDTTAPTVSMSAPTNGSTVSGSVTVSATASDNVGVAGVQFLLDGASLGAEDTTAPYSVVWNTTQASAGSHVLSARARDAAGNTATSANVTVTVAQSTTNKIVLENQNTGTSAWQVTNTVTEAAPEIEGYAGATSVNLGGTLPLKVSLRTAGQYVIDVYRLGWYGGLGGRLMVSSGPLSGSTQAPCLVTDQATLLIECKWTTTYTVNVGADWTSGLYVAKLTASASGKQSQIWFVVRDDASNSGIVFQSSFNTFLAYNHYGTNERHSLYAFNSTGGERALKVSYDRPFGQVTTDQARYDNMLDYEANMVRWLESQGYDVSYISTVDTHANPGRLLQHKIYLSVGHDEYWSKEMRDGVEAARDAGINLGFFSANTAYWRVRFEPSSSGEANRVMVCYKDPAVVDPVAPTYLWRGPENNRPENALLGVMYVGDNSFVQYEGYDFRVVNTTDPLYRNTGLTDGTTLFRLVGFEWDGVVNNGFTPPGVVVLARSTVQPTEIAPGLPPGTDTTISNAVRYTAPSGAKVVSIGSIQWLWSLDSLGVTPPRTDLRMKQFMVNVLGDAGVRPVTPASDIVLP